MQIPEALEIAQTNAVELMTGDLYDAQRGIPMRATSHTDLWPGDRWVEAYLAAGKPVHAHDVMTTTMNSIREDGSLPHLMQGSHKRGGIETRFIDRLAYRQQGNGAEKLPNGRWVTKSYGMPTLALSALALKEHQMGFPDSEYYAVERTMNTLYEARGEDDGAIYAHHIDELTNSKSRYAQQVKETGKAADPAVNALAVLNGNAVSLLALQSVRSASGSVFSSKQETASWLALHLRERRSKQGALINEEVLAAARMGDGFLPPTEHELRSVYEQPEADDKHPENTHLTLAECLEIARLTPDTDATQEYLHRVLPKVALLGAGGMTRFEGLTPGDNAVTNKLQRKQIWLPVAAEIVQLQV